MVGHSAGWAAVGAYVVERQDPRVVGVVLASGAVGSQQPPRNQELLREATRLVRDGAGEDLIRLPNRASPSFISAATLLDQGGEEELRMVTVEGVSVQAAVIDGGDQVPLGQADQVAGLIAGWATQARPDPFLLGRYPSSHFPLFP